MYQRIKAARNNEGGFTLIELLIVIVILGILAGVVIFASAGFKNKGAAEACKTTLSSVKTAVEAYHVDDANAKYPTMWLDISNPAPVAPAVSYFDANGVTAAPSVNPATAFTDTVKGKGWAFRITWGNSGAPAALDGTLTPKFDVAPTTDAPVTCS